MRPPVAAAACAVLLLACCASNPRLERLAPAAAPPGGRVLPDAPWAMHVIDNPNRRLPNGLDAADADGDGRVDLLTNYEWDGLLRIAFMPEAAGVRSPWPAVTVGRAANAESSTFADVDGDGDPDVLVAHGTEALGASGVAVLFNPGGASARTPAAWPRALDFPAAAGLGHLHYVRSSDVDGDGRLEIVIGGRGVGPRPGLRILVPPSAGSRAQVARWTLATVDPDLESGHGFEIADLDGDGDEDIALANSDWDTEPEQQAVIWYENPGGARAFAGPWPKHVLYQAPDFYTKEQVAIADADHDGRNDIVVHLRNALYLFRRDGPGERVPSFVRLVIPKPQEARWRARTLQLGDIDGDGELDVVGALIHDNGSLPTDKAAVFWMDVDWRNPEAPAPTRVVKWGSGFRGAGPLNGEKWDQAVLVDVDGDGDLDIAANCEEFDSMGTVRLSVVWFENPLQ